MTEARYRQYFVAICLIFLVAVNMAFISLAIRTPADHTYIGMGHEAVADKFVYYAMILQGKEGHLFMQNPHTSEPQKGSLFSPQWLATGLLATALGGSVPIAYHVMRIILSLVFLWLLYLFVNKLFPQPAERLIATIGVLGATGWGWLYVVVHPWVASPAYHWLLSFNIKPVDLYVTEMLPFKALAQAPLFILSYILLLAIFYILLHENYRTKGWWLLGGALALLLVLVHPYDAIILLTVVGTWAVWKLLVDKSWPVMSTAVSIFIGVGGGLSYHAFSCFYEPALAGWLAQNITRSPPLMTYVWGLGALLPLWLLGLVCMLRQREKNPWLQFMGIWSVAILLIMYLPLNINRRFANAWFIPLAIVAAYGVVHLLRRIKKSYILQCVVVSMITIAVFGGTVYQVIQYAVWYPPADQKYSYYLDPYITDALAHIQQYSGSPTILANEEFMSLVVAAAAPVKVYVGHAHQTAHFFLKLEQQEWFFGANETPTAETRKEAFLHANGISYLFVYRPSLVTDASWVSTAPFLQPVYHSAIIDMYKVL